MITLVVFFPPVVFLSPFQRVCFVVLTVLCCVNVIIKRKRNRPPNHRRNLKSKMNHNLLLEPHQEGYDGPNKPLKPDAEGYGRSPNFIVRRLEILTMVTVTTLIASFFLEANPLSYKMYALTSFTCLLGLLNQILDAARSVNECVPGSPASTRFEELKESEGRDSFEHLRPQLVLHFLKFVLSQVVWQRESHEGFHMFSETYDIISISKANFDNLCSSFNELLSKVCGTSDAPSKITITSIVVLQIVPCDVFSSGLFGQFTRNANVAKIYLAKVSPVAFYPIERENYDQNGVNVIIEFMSAVLNANFANPHNCPKAAFLIFFIVSVVYGRKVCVFPFFLWR